MDADGYWKVEMFVDGKKRGMPFIMNWEQAKKKLIPFKLEKENSSL